MPLDGIRELTKWRRHGGEDHRRNYAIAAVCIRHSHSIVPGGFDV